MPEVTGIDHIYITVSDLQHSEAFYDLVLRNTLGFRKNNFTLGSDLHIQYFNCHFGFVIRPARSDFSHDSYSPGLHHFCFRVDLLPTWSRLLKRCMPPVSALQKLGCIRNMHTIIGQFSSVIQTVSGWKSPTTGRSVVIAAITGISVDEF